MQSIGKAFFLGAVLAWTLPCVAAAPDSLRAARVEAKKAARSEREAGLYGDNICIGITLEEGFYIYQAPAGGSSNRFMGAVLTTFTLDYRSHYASRLGLQMGMGYAYITDENGHIVSAEAKHIFGPYGRFVIEPMIGYDYGWWRPRGQTNAAGERRTYHLKSFYAGPGASLYLGDKDDIILSAGGKLGRGYNPTGLIAVYLKVSYGIPFGG